MSLKSTWQFEPDIKTLEDRAEEIYADARRQLKDLAELERQRRTLFVPLAERIKVIETAVRLAQAQASVAPTPLRE